MKRRWLAYLIATALAVVIVLLCVSMERENGGTDAALTVSYFSDGFFLAAVMYVGCGLLTFISEAGNFYGLQYLGYTLVRVFSPRKERFEDRKDYFTYCTEKKARQAEKGKSSVKWVMLHVGLACLAVSVILALVFYRMA
ncbi:MAG: DUF3899 domain-containing protein [Aristaeellaceae bacterium]